MTIKRECYATPLYEVEASKNRLMTEANNSIVHSVSRGLTPGYMSVSIRTLKHCHGTLENRIVVKAAYTTHNGRNITKLLG